MYSSSPNQYLLTATWIIFFLNLSINQQIWLELQLRSKYYFIEEQKYIYISGKRGLSWINTILKSKILGQTLKTMILCVGGFKVMWGEVCVLTDNCSLWHLCKNWQYLSKVLQLFPKRIWKQCLGTFTCIQSSVPLQCDFGKLLNLAASASSSVNKDSNSTCPLQVWNKPILLKLRTSV